MGRAADAAISRIRFRQGLEHSLRGKHLFFRETRQGQIRVVRERVCDRSGVYIMWQVDVGIALLFPGAHQRVLQHGQLVGFFADIIEQAFQQLRRDRAAEQVDRAFDGLAQLFARQAGDQVLALIHRFGQAVEVVAIADEIRAHRHDDVNRQVPLPAQGQHDLDESRRLRAVFGLVRFKAEAEQLFELIDQQQQIGLFQRGRQVIALGFEIAFAKRFHRK